MKQEEVITLSAEMNYHRGYAALSLLCCRHSSDKPRVLPLQTHGGRLALLLFLNTMSLVAVCSRRSGRTHTIINSRHSSQFGGAWRAQASVVIVSKTIPAESGR